MEENQLNLLKYLNSNSDHLNNFLILKNLDEMYEYSKKLIETLTEKEFIDFLLNCVFIFQSKSLKNLSEENIEAIGGGNLIKKSKIVSSLILPLIFSSSLSATSVPQNNFLNLKHINNTCINVNKDKTQFLTSSHINKSFYNTLLKVGECVLPLSLLLVSSCIYKNSDNFFQRTTIGNIENLRSIHKSYLKNVKEEDLVIGKRLKGRVYTGISNSSSELMGKTVIFYSGSGNSMTRYIQDLAQWYTSMGATVIGVDYTGFGESEIKNSSGEIRQKNIYRDAQEIYDYVKNAMHTDPANIIIHGFSLGGPVAAHVAANASERNDKLCGLILQSSIKNTVNAANNFLKKRNVVIRLLGSLGAYLFADQFDCEKELKRIFKANSCLPISICGGDNFDGLNLTITKLDEIAKKIGFNCLTIFSGTEGHTNNNLAAPKENINLPEGLKRENN